MTDVFDSLVGHERARDVLRQHARHPVHAYLFSGPPEANLHDVLVAFAASLQCAEFGCGTCEVCRRVREGSDPDVYVAERAGVSWRMEEIREVERVARRRPLAAGYQIVILDEVELTTTSGAPSAAALLKTLEEPPARTVFLLSAHDVPDELGTIASRCVEVRLRGLNDDDIAAVLIAEGATPPAAHDAAGAANGSLRRARVLIEDPELARRLAQWRAVPERLTGAPADSTRVARELAGAIDDAMGPLERLQREESERRRDDARQTGSRGPNKRDLESQFKREQRRFRQDELRCGLGALTGVYRERLAENLTLGDARSDYRVGASLRALDALAEAYRRLETNLDESLLLNDLMLTLSEF